MYSIYEWEVHANAYFSKTNCAISSPTQNRTCQYQIRAKGMKISCATSGFTMYKDFGRDVRDHLISSILIHNNLLKQQVFKRRNGLRGRRKMRWKNGALSPLLTLLHIIHGVREAHMFRNREQFIVQINHESELLLIALTERPREEEYTHTHTHTTRREKEIRFISPSSTIVFYYSLQDWWTFSGLAH
jgi:hypothetical protein